MPNPIAILVEDDPDQSEFSKEVLEAAGFAVEAFDAISPAMVYLESNSDLIDLFVLDRRLPVNAGEPDADELGDELLRQVRSSHPDARIIVFTGHADVPHLQKSLSKGGQLPGRDGQAVDRVTVLKKEQSLEFEQEVKEYRHLIQALDDIEVTPTDPTEMLDTHDLRVIRRIGFEYRAASVEVTRLPGGLTGASVWKCGIRRAAGDVGTVVAKLVESKEPLGGLQELLTLGKTASKVASISGLVGGGHINVLQLAGDDPHPLMDLLVPDQKRAVELAQQLWAELDGVPDNAQVLQIDQICAPLLDWPTLVEVLEKHSIPVPAGTLSASVHLGIRHCDLHPANVLIDDEAVVLIDCDASTFGARAVDPVTMLLSTLVHPASPIRGSLWVDASHIASNYGTESFGQGHQQEFWFRNANDWVQARKTSEREFWALSLVYAARQLRYPNITGDPPTLERVVAIARLASASLNES